MTREQQEAIAVLQEFYDYNKTLTPHGESWLQADITINRETQRNLAEALPLAIKAMSRLLTDPDTGLMPCGCGGVTEQTDFHDGFFPHSKVDCLECGIEIMRAGNIIAEAHDEAKRDWNHAMGLLEVEG